MIVPEEDPRVWNVAVVCFVFFVYTRVQYLFNFFIKAKDKSKLSWSSAHFNSLHHYYPYHLWFNCILIEYLWYFANQKQWKCLPVGVIFFCTHVHINMYCVLSHVFVLNHQCFCLQNRKERQVCELLFRKIKMPWTEKQWQQQSYENDTYPFNHFIRRCLQIYIPIALCFMKIEKQ